LFEPAAVFKETMARSVHHLAQLVLSSVGFQSMIRIIKAPFTAFGFCAINVGCTDTSNIEAQLLSRTNEPNCFSTQTHSTVQLKARI